MRTAILVLAMAGSLLAQRATKPGTERWAIKTGIPDRAKLKSGIRVDIADLIALPDASGITKDEKKYQTVRIPAQSGSRYAEGDVITTTGWLHLVAGETDGDRS